MTKNTEIAKLRTPLVIIATAVAIGGIIWASSVLIPLVFAMFFAALLNPICNWLESKNFHRIFAALLSVMLGLGILVLLFWFIASQVANIADDFENIESRLQEVSQAAEEYVQQNLGLDVSLDMDTLMNSGMAMFEEAGGALLKGILGVFVLFAMFILVPIYTFLLLIYRFFLKDFLIKAFAGDDPQKTREIVNNIQQVAQNYLSGRLKVIVIIGIMFAIALSVIGLEHAIFFAIFAALFDFVYFIGPIIAAILPIMYALVMEDELWVPVAVGLSFYIIQMIEGNILTPKIVGPAVSINPLVTLVALFAGNLIWGISGMILILPALAILKIIFDEFESTRPYGYLLGDTQAQKEPTWISKKVQQILPNWKDKE